MRKIALSLTAVAILMTASSSFAAMTFGWVGRDGVPNIFKGKVTSFYYHNLDQVTKDRQPEAVVDVTRSDGSMVEVTFSGNDLAFGSSLHSEVGKDVSLLMVDKNDVVNPGGVVTQFSISN